MEFPSVPPTVARMIEDVAESYAVGAVLSRLKPCGHRLLKRLYPATPISG